MHTVFLVALQSRQFLMTWSHKAKSKDVHFSKLARHASGLTSMSPSVTKPVAPTIPTSGAVALVVRTRPAELLDAADAVSSTPPTEHVFLALNPRWYRVCWSGVLLLHGLCAVYLVSVGMLYRYMDDPYLTYFADLLGPAPDRHFNLMAAAIIIVACGHLWCFVEMIVISVANRELSMWRNDADLSQKSPSTSTFSRLHRELSSHQVLARHASRLKSALEFGDTAVTRAIWHSVFSRHGLLGIESVHFDAVFIVREFAEIGLQTYQAYRTSQMITRRWINTLFVALVVANCWTTPLWQLSLKRSPALCRLCCVATDIVLNMGTNMVIPWVIFRTYFEAYDADQFSFDLSLLYDDIWFTNLVMENRLLFALSGLDFLSKFVPHVTILICLVGCKSLLVRNTKPQSKVADGAPRPQRHVVVATKRVGWKAKATYALFFTWGGGLLLLHYRAAGLDDSAAELVGCKQFISPWFVSNIACATYEHNCHRVPSTELSLAAALQLIHPSTLLSLVVSHCEELVMPRELQLFPNLLSLELYNATLREWSTDAAVSASIHTSLVALLLIRVNMTALPDGVLGPLPDSLTDVEIAYTNLTHLPDDLHMRWHAMAVLYLEFSDLREFPATLTQLEIYDLSLIGNRLEFVPALASLSSAFFFLALSHNPIRELPAAVDSGVVFGFLSLEHTALDALPSWTSDPRVVESLVYVKDSPVCEMEEHATQSPLVTCTEADPRGQGRYPLEIMAPRRVP